MVEFESPINSNSLVLANIGKIDFKTNRVYLMYGKAKMGKTWISSWLCRKITNKDKKVIYIDSEGKAKRWFRKWDDYEGLLKNRDYILYKKVKNNEEFNEIINKLKDIVVEAEPIAIIVDTILYPYAEMDSRTRAKRIKKVSKRIREICLDNELLGLITTRIRWDKQAKGGQSLYHNTDHQIKIKEFENKDMKEISDEDFMSDRRMLVFDKNLTELITIKNGKIEVLG